MDMMLYDTNVVLLNPNEFYAMRADFSKDNKHYYGSVEFSIGSRMVKIHMYNSCLGLYIRKVKMLHKAFDLMCEWLSAKRVLRAHYRKFLNPPSSSMGGTVYAFYDGYIEGEDGKYSYDVDSFIELSDCTNKIRLWVYNFDDISVLIKARDILAEYLVELEKHK